MKMFINTLQKKTLPLSATLFCVLFSCASAALETQWIEFEQGFIEKGMGAQLQDIQYDEAKNQQILSIDIPKKSLGEYRDIEEVVVIGIRDEKKPPQPIAFSHIEWIENPDADHYGILLRIHKDIPFPLRLYFKADVSNDISP
ncbi:MAG: hypothetical protein HRU20_09805 [Pseudomonadales bacterium]|nr:hypothetical protein [Pseudomonadales bacterium]